MQKINVDVDKLQDALKQCNRVNTRFKNREDRRKDVLEQLNIAWVIAEKCNVWAENMQVCPSFNHQYSDDKCYLGFSNFRSKGGGTS